MTKSKRNLFVSVLVLILTVAIAGGSTYAWFTTNKNVTIADMDVNVTTGTQGLYVAPKVEGPYKSYLSAADLTTAGFVPTRITLDNVTSADGMAFKNLTGANLTHPGAGDGVMANWVEFKIFFQATGQAGDTAPKVDLSKLIMSANGVGKDLVYELDAPVDTATKFGNSTGIKTADGHLVASQISNGEKIPGKAINAARMSFTAQDSTVRVWDPHKKDNATFCGATFDNTILTENFAIHYYNELKVKQGLTSEKIAGPITLPTTQETAAFEKDVLKLVWDTTAKAFRAELTIRIWLEGFDGDCTNAIFADGIKTQLIFTVATV